MAVHVVQGRDPWWSSLAVNVLGGLFNDWQQREHNKKEAAYLGELAKMYEEMQNGQNDTAHTPTPAPVQNTGQGLLNMNMTVPEGYNNNGWANAFHKNESPLLQFDLGTAGLAPTAPTTTSAPATTAPTNAWANALGNSGNSLAQFDANTAGLIPPATQIPATATAQPTQAQSRGIPTPMDFYRAALELAGSKRFRMLNPDRVQAMLTPYMKMNEEARQEQMRNALADDYMNATDGAGRIRTVTGGALRGIVPESMATTVFNQNKPIQSTVDAGGQIHFYNTDPMTGMPINTWEVDRTLTPQQQLDNQFRMLQHEAQQAQLREQMNYNREGRAWEQGYKDRQLAVESNQVTGTPFTGNDGYQYIMTRNGNTIKITDVPGLTPAQTKILETHENNLRRIATEKERLQIYKGQLINKGIPSDDPEMIGINKRLQEIETQEKGIKGDISNILQSVSTGQQGQQGHTGQQTEQFLPPVAPPVNKYISQQEYDSYLREAEKGTLTAKGTPIRNRQELDEYLRSKGYVVLDNSRTSIPVTPQTESPDIAQPTTQITSLDITQSSPDITQLGRNDAVSNTEVLASDTNTEAGIQRAIEELNGQFGEQRWADWASGLDLRGLGNMVTNLQSTNPNKPIKILGVPLVYPNGQINRYAPMGGRDLLDRDLRSPEEKFRDMKPIPNAPLDAPNNEGFQLASNRRASPQRTYSGYYSGDTANGGQYSGIINRQAKTHNVDPDLIAAIIQQESGGNSRVVSKAGAGGLMQLMPKTARGLGVTDVFDPEQNIAGGTKYIAQMLRRYNGNVEKALWAYNAGPGNADKGNLPEETKKYIPSVMARYRRLKSIVADSPNTTKRTTRRRNTRSRRRR